jgi:hypothetical protein
VSSADCRASAPVEPFRLWSIRDLTREDATHESRQHFDVWSFATDDDPKAYFGKRTPGAVAQADLDSVPNASPVRRLSQILNNLLPDGRVPEPAQPQHDGRACREDETAPVRIYPGRGRLAGAARSMDPGG